MSQAYYSCAELAAMKLPGMPGTKRGMIDFVRRESWESRQRTARGGGLEYLPPAPVAAMILATHVVAPVTSLPAAFAAPALPAVASTTTGLSMPAVSAHLTDKQRLERDARAGVLAAIQRLQEQAGCSQEAAITTLLVGARAGKLDEHLDRLLRLARDPRGRVGDGYPSVRSVNRWLGATDLAPRQKAKDMRVPAWAPAFMAAWQQPQKPSLQAAYRQAFGVEPLGQARGNIPSIHQVRRFIDKVGTVSAAAGRLLPRELKTIRPFVRRKTDHMWPDDAYTADGHTFDAEIAHPKHGRPFRPEITTVLSIATRKCVGWSVNLAESTWAVLDAQRHAIETHGIPALWYVDNGSGYKNAMQADEVVGFAARLGIEITHSLPYNSQARGLEERSHRTLLVAAAKKLPTYMGEAMDREARQKVHKITRADIRVAGTSRMLMDFQDFLAFLAAEIEAYNARPHRGLAKIVDADGKRRHMSPNEAWEAARAEGWEPTTLATGEADELFRPHTTTKVLRGEIRLFNNLYFSAALEEFHGETVRVGYDIHDASRVWVRDHQDGRLICVAEFEANHRAYFPQSVIDKAAEKRAQAREKRLQAHLDEVHDELHGRVQALEHQPVDSLNAQVFAAIRQAQEVQHIEARPIQEASVTVLANVEARPMFGNDPDLYRWLMRHPAHWTEADADWLLDYAASDDYADLAERYAHQGVAWSADDRERAENLLNKEVAAL